MIKLTSFYPFQGLLRVTQEFHEDKFIVKAKSITFEIEEEYSYDEIAEIWDSFHSSGSQMNAGAWGLILGNLLLFLDYFGVVPNDVLLRIGQFIFLSGLLLHFFGYYKKWHIHFSDKDGQILTTAKLTNHNRENIFQAIDMILNKSEKTIYITATEPFPEITPAFEHTYIDFANLKKTTDKFYNNEIIRLEKGLLTEQAYIVKYTDLSGRTYNARISNKLWEITLNYATLAFFTLLGLRFGFDILSGKVMLYIVFGYFIVLGISGLLNLIKRDAIGYYGTNGQIRYSAYVDRSKKDTIWKITEYIKSRIPAENKEVSLKENP